MEASGQLLSLGSEMAVSQVPSKKTGDRAVPAGGAGCAVGGQRCGRVGLGRESRAGQRRPQSIPRGALELQGRRPRSRGRALHDCTHALTIIECG